MWCSNKFSSNFAIVNFLGLAFIALALVIPRPHLSLLREGLSSHSSKLLTACVGPHCVPDFLYSGGAIMMTHMLGKQ